MSFGFSPGDITLFLGFATKVIKALKEAGGSKSEYCLAQQQCQGFLKVMDDIQRLDLSSVSESFRNHIEEYSTHTREFVKGFKGAIVKYEKSMGKSSHRGFVSSAPRKLQWAFSAADDLDKFRQSLSAQVNLVHITISNAILSIITRSNQPQQLLLEPSHNSAFSKAVYSDRHRQSYLDWNYNLINSLDMLERVDSITDLVYERLLTRQSGLLLADHPRVHTLPHNESSPTPDAISQRRTLPPAAHLDKVTVVKHQNVRSAQERTHSVHQETLAGEINEYLRFLSLEELSEQDAEQVNQIGSQRLLLNGPEEEPSEPLPRSMEYNRDQPQPSGSEGQRSRFRRRLPPFIRHGQPSSFVFSMDTRSSTTLEISITQLISSAAKISFDIMQTRNSFKELVMFSRRIRQFSSVLETATNVICISMSAEQQRLGFDIVQQGQAAISEVYDILDLLNLRLGSGLWPKYIGLVRLVRTLLWKKRVLILMDEIESLKSTFSIMLQTQHFQISERSFAEIQYAGEMQMQTLKSLEIQRFMSARN